MPTEYREERHLVLKNAADQNLAAALSDDSRVVAEALRLVPANAGFYRASAAPSVDETLELLESKILNPRTGPAPPETVAPASALTEGTVGSASSLETRIDLPPSTSRPQGKRDDALKAMLTKANVRAVLQLHRSEANSDGVFVRLRSTIVLYGGQ